MCGIFSIINSKPRKFDYTTFCVLGVNNDSRGGDSCGVFIDGLWEVGVDKKKEFRDFFKESSVLNRIKGKNVSIALGHCRKASVGGVSDKTAQPVVLTDKAGNAKFVMIHNGTIHNYEELAKKYIPKIDIKGLTDSQVMARIFYYKGYDCLSEYNGGSVFLIVDYRQPEPRILIFRGASKKYSTSTTIEEERPFYFIQNKNEFVCSSIDKYLEVLRPDDEVFTVEDNVLIQVLPGDIVNVKSYDRSNCQQSKVVNYTTGNSYGTVWQGNQSGSTYGGTYYQGGGYRGGAGVGHTTPAVGSEFNRGGTSTGSSIDRVTSIGPKFLRPDKTTNLYFTDKAKTIRAHGQLSINDFGRMYTGEAAKEESSHTVKEIWFFNGIALLDVEYFRFLEFALKKSKMSKEEFMTKYQNLIRFVSLDKLYSMNGSFHLATGFSSHRPFTGEFQMIGDSFVSEFKDGQTSCYRNIKNYDHPLDLLGTKGISVTKLYKRCKSLMK